MRTTRDAKRLVAGALCATLGLSSTGLPSVCVAARPISVPRAPLRFRAAPVLLGPSIRVPAPRVPAAAGARTVEAAKALVLDLDAVIARPLADPEKDPASRLRQVYDDGLRSGEVGAPVSPAAALPGVVPTLAPAGARAGISAARAAGLAPPARSERQNRSALFSLVLTASSGLGWLAAKTAEFGLAAAEPTVASLTMLGLTGAFLLCAVVEAVVYGVAMRRGRHVTDDDFNAFIRQEIVEGRLSADDALFLKPYRPRARWPDFTFGFVARGSIWLRPELIATPRLLRPLLTHELYHWNEVLARGPPARGIRGVFPSFLSEVRARWAELGGAAALKRLGIPMLARVLRQGGFSLRRAAPYKMLVLNAGSRELEDPNLYAGLSGGAAHISSVSGVEPVAALGAVAARGYKVVVLGGSAALLPMPRSKLALRFEKVIHQLMNLADEKGRDFWRSVAAPRFKNSPPFRLAERLYEVLEDGGLAFLTFAPEESGVMTWEGFLSQWESSGGGRFLVTRVDLESGGHVLIANKKEARVGLWLRPAAGGRIKTSMPMVPHSEAGRRAAAEALKDAGLEAQLAVFDRLGIRIESVFGTDVGLQEEIYVTVPRRHAAAARKIVGSAFAQSVDSYTAFQPQLIESAGLQGVSPVWRMGVTGEGGKIMLEDTGYSWHEDIGDSLDVLDMVDEGPEDLLSHGTHLAGIVLSRRAPFLGMAKGATGTMAKIFPRDRSGASDGHIKGGAAVAIQRGYDVISLSLSGRGGSAGSLTEFFSQLTHRRNAAGEFTLVVASAGNSGPVDRSVGQPAAGVDVLAVGAASKSPDDGRPEVASFSAVGPVVEQHAGLRFFVWKPEILGIGGDGETNEVYSAKSKDAPQSDSDLEDGLHTGKSGTSMSAPAVAAIALLVKNWMAKSGVAAPFVAENLPFALKAILMSSAKDLGEPVWFQGAGLVDANAAAALVSSAEEEGWGWLERLKAVVDAQGRVVQEVEAAQSRAQARFADVPREDYARRVEAGNAIKAEVVGGFESARSRELPALLAALKDASWLVRARAALALMNLRAQDSALALADVALNDPDARVRQTALLALAEIPTHAVDVLLQRASNDDRWDVGVYAAYALARRGDLSGAARLARELSNPEKSARLTAAWLSGQLGMQAKSQTSESLSARLSDPRERGNIRNVVVTALANLADAAPESVSDRVVTDLLPVAGEGRKELTYNLVRFFDIALRDRSLVARLRREPLKPIVTDFVLRNRGALQTPGALAELVQTLASAAGIPLDAPTKLPDPAGAGVRGVDAALGPLDLLVTPPAGLAPAAYADQSEPGPLAGAFEAAGLDATLLARYEGSARAVLPASGVLWLSVPNHNLQALLLELQRRGCNARRASPDFPLARGESGGGGYVLDPGEELSRLRLPAAADISFVRVRAGGGVSEARVMAALEKVAARARGRGPVVISLALASAAPGPTPLSALIDALVVSGVGVVVGAGNGGPASSQASLPGDSKLAVVVAAASRENGLQFYSERGASGQTRITWTDLVEDLSPDNLLAGIAAWAGGLLSDRETAPQGAPAGVLGTGGAAESTARKLAALARVLQDAFEARGRPLPEGWFPFLVSVVSSTLTRIPDHAVHEVGAGVFDDEDAARRELDFRLRDLDAVARDCEAAAARSRAAVAPPSPDAGQAGLLGRAWRAARRLLSRRT